MSDEDLASVIVYIRSIPPVHKALPKTEIIFLVKYLMIMPWWHFRNLTDDLKAMFAYLRTLKPVKHQVDNTEPPTLCKLCGSRHGLGDRN